MWTFTAIFTHVGSIAIELQISRVVMWHHPQSNVEWPNKNLKWLNVPATNIYLGTSSWVTRKAPGTSCCCFTMDKGCRHYIKEVIEENLAVSTKYTDNLWQQLKSTDTKSFHSSKLFCVVFFVDQVIVSWFIQDSDQRMHKGQTRTKIVAGVSQSVESKWHSGERMTFYR